MILTTVTSMLRSIMPPTERLGEIGARLAITLLVAFIVIRVLFLLASRLERLIERAGGGDAHATQRARTLGGIMRSMITFVVGAGACVHGLEILGWNVGPVLAGAGVLGVAVGFGAQALIRDIISGLFILAEDQFAVGDVIEVNGVPATVEDIAVRSTTLRDGNGFMHFVPNGEIRTVINRSRGWNRATADVMIAADQDPDRALEVCAEVVRGFNADPEWRARLLDPAELWGIESLSEDGVRLRVSSRTRPGADSAIAARELRRRLHRALLEAGIELGPRREGRARQHEPSTRP